MAVAADDGHSRLSEAVLRADHVNDPVFGMAKAVVGESELPGIFGQGVHLVPGNLIADGLVLFHGRDVVVGRK
ncbi:hypothetical protein SDC9_118967 [bioreactor metagenome]|uniref:Uncharacterized protein n=1 Tax=bioreactor metagenome TaxID=1076179 RepID=A0A645C981_9ZZZZ